MKILFNITRIVLIVMLIITFLTILEYEGAKQIYLFSRDELANESYNKYKTIKEVLEIDIYI